MNKIEPKDGSFDFIIIGAGASGLSLFLELNVLDSTRKVAVLERNAVPMNDRIWSFWQSVDEIQVDRKQNHIKSIISNRWSQWSLSTSQQRYAMQSDSYRYCSIRADAFNQLALKSADKNPLSTILFNCDVQSIDRHGEHVLVRTTNDQFLAKKVIDTRPPPLDKNHQGLLQCFYGEEITLDTDVFDDSTVKLMDQLSCSELGIEFVYILPFSPRQALIEFTCFSKTHIDKAILKARLQDIIKDIVKHHNFKVLRAESATLPMYLINQNTFQNNKQIIHAGIAGGAMRATTGYSFLNSQRWAKHYAKALISDKPMSQKAPVSWLYQHMDMVMLKVLRDDMKIGVTIFERMFKSVKPASFARFMTERASLSDLLSVIWAMPKTPFIRAACSLIFSHYNFSREDPVNKNE